MFLRVAPSDVGDKARRATWAVGVEMLYGALVFVRIWMSGGCAIAMPSLREMIMRRDGGRYVRRSDGTGLPLVRSSCSASA